VNCLVNFRSVQTSLNGQFSIGANRVELKTLKLAGIRLDIEIAIESKKLDLELLMLENKIAALKQPSSKAEASAPAPLRRPMQTRNDVENGFDTDFDQDPVPGHMFPDDDRLDLIGLFQNSVAIQYSV
jgi:hypothetical protein